MLAGSQRWSFFSDGLVPILLEIEDPRSVVKETAGCLPDSCRLESDFGRGLLGNDGPQNDLRVVHGYLNLSSTALAAS